MSYKNGNIEISRGFQNGKPTKYFIFIKDKMEACFEESDFNNLKSLLKEIEDKETMTHQPNCNLIKYKDKSCLVDHLDGKCSWRECNCTPKQEWKEPAELLKDKASTCCGASVWLMDCDEEYCNMKCGKCNNSCGFRSDDTTKQEGSECPGCSKNSAHTPMDIAKFHCEHTPPAKNESWWEKEIDLKYNELWSKYEIKRCIEIIISQERTKAVADRDREILEMLPKDKKGMKNGIFIGQSYSEKEKGYNQALKEVRERFTKSN